MLWESKRYLFCASQHPDPLSNQEDTLSVPQAAGSHADGVRISTTGSSQNTPLVFNRRCRFPEISSEDVSCPGCQLGVQEKRKGVFFRVDLITPERRKEDVQCVIL
ncbi:hypothetical protein KOW79_012611 [Hemibagrus wyckioides]|uniref:Uncharacterized protein n=1 Tax=Hemibagrus wyckioides TaxID=337641 RepID=A0A9D3NM37_9TELE|nr:hypothetical protein KOW79_012611 [Hemibagrus wyckioides]